MNPNPLSPPTFDRVAGFIRAHTGTHGRVGPETTVSNDLHMDGDCAADFMEAFAERFGIESGDFDFHRYFGTEGFNPSTIIALFLRPAPGKVALTVAMLCRAVELGVWKTARIEEAQGPSPAPV